MAEHTGAGRDLYLDAEKFQFLLIALAQLAEPLIGHEKFRVTLEKDPEQKSVAIRYSFE